MTQQQSDFLRPMMEEKLAEAESTLERAVASLLEAKAVALMARRDVEAYRQAIEALSRNNGHRYIARPVVTPVDELLGISKGEKPAGRNSAAPLRITKSGLVRAVIRENPGLKTRQLYDKLCEKNPPIEMGINDVHRVLARLVMREEIKRDSLGRIYLTAKAISEDD